MSYDIYLKDPVSKKTIEIDDLHFMQGGTHVIGGTNELWLNVTYNYTQFYNKVEAFEGKGIRSIYGKTGHESIPILEKAIDALGDDTDPDYWRPTEGNAKRSLVQLLTMARMRPDGIWSGD